MNQLEREISGALKNTIDSHGPITRELIGSASKRIAGQIREAAKRERDHLLTTTPRKPKP
jgi:hypothetical protein